MSSKKRKSTGCTWYICDVCKSILQVKDTLLHKEKSCLMNEINFLIHPYIKNLVLYCNTELFKIEDVSSLRNIPSAKLNDFVIVQTAALQLMKVPIGEPVLICPMNEQKFTPFVKNVWPQSDINFSLGVTKQVAELYFLNSEDSVSVHPLQENVNIAHQVTLKIETTCYLTAGKSLMTKLHNLNIGKIYCVGNKLAYNHYGKTLIFKIVNIEPLLQIGNEQNVDKINHVNLFSITEDTKWQICQKTDIDENVINKVKFHQIGGLNDIIKELEDIVSLAIQADDITSGMYVTRGILIYGPGGTGKTSLVENLAGKFRTNIVKIETSQIFSKYLGEAERQLTESFEKAKQLSPSIVLIDELDSFCPKITGRNDQEKRIIATLSVLLDKLHSEDNSSVLVFATTSKINDVHKSLRRPGRFGKEFEINVPNSNQRKEILKIHLENVNHNLEDEDIKEIADLSHGFVGADLLSLVSKAILQKRKECFDVLSVQDFHSALTKVKPSAMREILVEIPNVHWSDIGGQEELKLKLKQAVEWPLKYEESFRRLGIVSPRGLLMFGPPGCSKTMIAKALATESKLNFISVKGPELFSKWVGESEKAVRDVFRRARQVAPCIIFFDELDAIGSERSNAGAGTNVEERVLAQLLTELDGVEPLRNVTIVGATNRLDRIDPALLRPGRLDRIIYVPLPDSKTRKQIFIIQFKKTPIGYDVNLDELVYKTEGYSGAEIVAVCHEAALKALEENFTASVVLRKHFLMALEIILPRTPKSLINTYEKYLC